MKLVTVTDLKSFLEINAANHDGLLDVITDQVSAAIEKYCNRNFEKVARTKYFNAGRRYFHLPAFPIDMTAELLVVNDTTTLVKDVDYAVWDEEGCVEAFYEVIKTKPRQVYITWTGGYDSDEIPSDLQEAAMLQSAFMFRRRKDIGVNSLTLPDGAISVLKPTELLPEVVRLIKTYRKSPEVI